MAVRSFAALKSEYEHLWATCQIRPERQQEVTAVARQIVINRGKYERIAQRTGVPWYVTGIIHAMECTQFPKFTQHLHNGDSIDRKTRLAPAGQPSGVWPPADKEADLFVESAVDALTMKGKRFDLINDWSVARICYVLETYNGWGYRGKQINSPYLWSYTNQYRSGKYVADRVWSATAVSKQCGGMAVLKALLEIDPALMGTSNPVVADRPWPKAEVKPTAYVDAAKSSITVWSLVVAAVMKVGEWLDRAFGLLPDIATDVDGLMAPITTLGGLLKINLAEVTTAVAVVCIGVAIFRHTRDKGELKDIKGE